MYLQPIRNLPRPRLRSIFDTLSLVLTLAALVLSVLLLLPFDFAPLPGAAVVALVVAGAGSAAQFALRRRDTLRAVAAHFTLGVFVVASLLFALSGVAHGQETGAAQPADIDVLAILRAFVGAIQGGQWPVAVVLGFVALIGLLKWGGAKWIPWLSTSEGGTVLALAAAAASTLGAAALGGVPITWALVWTAVQYGVSAIGGYVAARRLLRVLSPLVAKIPTVGPVLAKAIDWLSGASAKEEIAAQTAATYKPLDPAPDAQAAADVLSKPPAP